MEFHEKSDPSNVHDDTRDDDDDDAPDFRLEGRRRRLLCKSWRCVGGGVALGGRGGTSEGRRVAHDQRETIYV